MASEKSDKTQSNNDTGSSNGSSSSASKPESKVNSLFSSSSQTTSIKLDRSNFLVWESVVLPLIEGNRLEYHVDGSFLPPLKYVSAPGQSGEMISNPDYLDWYAVDRMLVGWLRNTMSLDVGSQLLHCATTRELWLGARDLTCAASRARIMVHRSELTRAQKGGLKMEEFLARMKNLSDQLSLAGSPISTEELVMHTLNGLDREYNAIVVKLLDHPGITWIDAQSSLLAFESRLDQLNQLSSLSIQPSANLAVRDSSSDRDQVAARRTSDNDRGTGWRGAPRGGRGCRGRGNGRGGRGFGYGNNGNGGRPFCTWCERHGHVYANCFQRLGYPPNQNGGRGSSPQAFYGAGNFHGTESFDDSAWFMDSGSNFHVTPTPENLDNVNPVGSGDRQAANGRTNKPRNVPNE